jgi:hypothetical protein
LTVRVTKADPRNRKMSNPILRGFVDIARRLFDDFVQLVGDTTRNSCDVWKNGCIPG